MIPNMIGFVKSVIEIKDHAKNFPNAPRNGNRLSIRHIRPIFHLIDFHPFPKLKKAIPGTQFRSDDDVRHAAEERTF